MQPMNWYHYFALFSALVFAVSFFAILLKLVKFGKPKDYSPPAGKVSPAVIYSFTGAMSPTKKESAFLHLPTYLAGIVYHLGTFLSILLFFLAWFNFETEIILSTILSVFLIISVICGIGILMKRIVKTGLRHLSNPDDYISNILVTVFQLFTALALLIPAVIPSYFVISGILLLYFPIGKLRHAVFFFAARYHLGFFFGRRGVWPLKPLRQ